MAYGADFRKCVIRNIEAGMSWRDAAKTFKISTGSIAKWLHNVSETGHIIDAPRKEYKPKKIDSTTLLAKIEETPDITLEELAEYFLCSGNSVWKRPKKARHYAQEKTTLYAERDEEKRAEFLAEIAQVNPADLVYLDESGIDEYLQRDYARAPRGNQVISDVYGRKYGRISVIAAWLPHTKKMIAPYVFDGHTDSKRFNGWLEKCLLPELKKGQVIIMDNATFHKSKRTKELIESAGCRLLFQPAYSPDLNPIEQQWAVLKRKFRKHKHKFKTFDQAVDYAFVV